VKEGQKTRPNQIEVIAKESTSNMTFPLVFLAFMSIAAGYVGLPNSVFGSGVHVFEGFLDKTFEPALAQKTLQNIPAELDGSTTILLLVISGIVALSGVGIAYLMYHRNRQTAPLRARQLAGPLYPISKNKWYFDEIYDWLLVKSGLAFEKGLWLFDRYVIDGAVNGTGWLTRFSARYLRKTQTGFVGNYALYMILGLVGVVGLFYLINGIK
jgi:NADH:ubiquinone oxidoreductase subunit 5 (subunit L)/multisubunit Na+/H+ antiporter MnhA subunit